MKRPALVLFFLLSFRALWAQTPSQFGSVKLMATVDSLVPSITLQWSWLPGAQGFEVYRRAAGATTWGTPMATLSSMLLQYADSTVQLGTHYEYKVKRLGATTGYGYLRSGIATAAIETRGAIVLLADSALASVLPMELEQLQRDLQGDGWRVVRHDVPQGATPFEVRELIIADHAAAPDEVKAVYILGHVAVPYSGNIFPDGHEEHQGAWPCDGYYGDVDGIWTDTEVNNATSNFPWNHNVPDDGKWDQDDLPTVELQVGRVDLSRLEALGTETALMSAYLNKAHAWKTGALEVPHTAVVWDNLTWVGTPVASSGFSSAAPCVGNAQLTELLPIQGQFRQHYLNNSDLFTFHCSTGLQIPGGDAAVFTGTENGLTIDDLPNNTAGGVFNMSLGSYYGDWDNADNFLRALITSGNALTHMWCGIPNWFLHPLAMGENMGYCALRTMNNTNADFSLQSGGFQGSQIGRAHLALMGDPSLRVRYVAPPAQLVAGNDQWFASFHWAPSPDEDVIGYHIYRVDDAPGTITRITPEPVQDTSFTSATVPFVPGDHYMVRALKLITSPSGSYYDLSLGVHAIAEGKQWPDCEGTLGGSALPGTPCDDGDPNTIGELYDSLCVCVAPEVGMEERQLPGISAWPSPADGNLNLQLPMEGLVLLRDTRGALLDSIAVPRGPYAMNTRHLPVGLYILEFRPRKGALSMLRFTVGR